jgi:hypothetical protein
MPTAPFVVQPQLTAIAIAYGQKLTDFIADLVMPRVKPISKREFEYLVYGLEAYSRPDTRVGRKGRPNEVSWASKSLTASVEDFSLDDPIPQDDIDQGGKDGINVTGLSTEYILSLIRLDRECRVADLVQNASSYNAANVQTLAGGQGLDNSEVNASKIINEILEKPIVRPNIGIMSRTVWGKVAHNALLVKAIRGSLGGDKITPQDFCDYFELESLLIGPARKNREVKGKNPTLESIWGPNIAFHYRDLAASTQRGVTWGLTVPYSTPVSGAIPDANIGMRGGVRVRAGESLKEVVLAPDAGCLIKNAIAV